jgi:uncharacterized membrane protein YccC
MFRNVWSCARTCSAAHAGGQGTTHKAQITGHNAAGQRCAVSLEPRVLAMSETDGSRPLPAPAVTRSSLVPGLQVSVRASLAAGLSVTAAQLLRLEFPIYAMIAAVIVTDLSPERTRQLGLPRLVGTVVGTTLGAALSSLLVPRPAAVVLTVMAAMFACHLLRLQDAAKVAGYVCGIVLLDHGEEPWIYGLYRLTETVLGIGAAVLVSLVPKLIDTSQHDPLVT